MTSPDRCFVSLAAPRCGHCSGHFHRKACRNPTPNTGKGPSVLGQIRTFTAFSNRSIHKIGRQRGRQCDDEGLQIALTGATAHQSSRGATHQSNASAVCFFFFFSLGFQTCLFSKAYSVHKTGLDPHQQKSFLSYKERALKSYYHPQSLHCCSVKPL